MAAERWTTWSGDLSCTPARTARPATVEQVADEIGLAREAGRRVRVAGTGHSFSPVALTDGTHLHLAGELARVHDVDRAAGLVRVGAGMPLHELSLELDRHGLALENLGDIDVQTVAGALSTATHGTGAAKPSLSAQVHAVELVDGTGALRTASADDHPALWRAARVSVGALGVLTAVTLRAVPAFTLRREDRVEPLDEVLDGLLERGAAAEHFELFAFPYANAALTRTSHVVDGPPQPPTARREAFDGWLTNEAFEGAQRLARRFPSTIPALCRLMTRAAGSSTRVDRSFRCFASPRRRAGPTRSRRSARAAARRSSGRTGRPGSRTRPRGS
jgi:L-gulono-1,4-lactone dehydrogenase